MSNLLAFSCLASGSKANSYLVRSEKTNLLIDCGLSVRELGKRLLFHEFNISQLTAVIVTHEHEDHIAGIKTLCLKHQIPLYVTEPVFESDSRLQCISLHQVFFFSSESSFEIGDLSIETFNVSHDAVQTVGLRIWNSNKSISILTDIGEYDDTIIERVCGADALVIEANHDQEKLWACAYPWYLKKRIAGAGGHLGNHHTTEFLKKLCKKKNYLNSPLKFLGAAHISDNSNTHELAYNAIEAGVEESISAPKLFVARQDKASEMFIIS